MISLSSKSNLRTSTHESGYMMIPYERQTGPETCGAAALVMAYRSYGRPMDQATVSSETGQTRSAVHFAAHARKQGFQAIIVRLNVGWQGLRTIRQTYTDCRIILNHRLTLGASYGHYSILADMTDEHVVLHDPLFGQNRRWPPETLDSMWETPCGEVTGRVVILIRPKNETQFQLQTCPECRSSNDLSAFEKCRRCFETVFCSNCDKPLY